MRSFEQSIGKESIAEALEAVAEKLTEAEHALLADLGGEKSLARLLAEHSIRPSKLMTRYAEGALLLGRTAALIEVASKQPDLVRDLLTHAIDQETPCTACDGSGVVKGSGRSLPCLICGGKGKRPTESPHKEFAMGNLLKITELVKDKPTVAVQTNVAISTEGFAAKALKAADAVLFPQAISPTNARDQDGI